MRAAISLSKSLKQGTRRLEMTGEDVKRQLVTYPIASGEMCYAVQNERAVYLQGDPETGFSLYGQIPGGGEASSVNLAEVLLEFAMTWNAPGDPSEARRQMQIFGGHIGEALATQGVGTKPVNSGLGLAAGALEDVFRSLDASFAYHQTKSEVRYHLDQSPLRVAAEVTGLEQEADLAHYAFNAICQSLVSALDPELRIQLPGGPNAEHTISVMSTASNGR
jgi:hypothetical protein